MISFLLSSFIPNNTENLIFKKIINDSIIVINASGSSKQIVNKSKNYIMTKPENTVYHDDNMYDWCSECNDDPNKHPWISFYLKSNRFELSGYYLRTGGCSPGTCYLYVEKKSTNCFLFSWSLQVSEDNKTWNEIHNVSKSYEVKKCSDKIFNFDKIYYAKYIRLIQTEPFPGEPGCMAINSIDFFGRVSPDRDNDFESEQEDDISIIGRISK